MRSWYELDVDLAIRAAPVARLRGPNGTSMVMRRVCRRSRAARDQAERSEARGQDRAERFHVNIGSSLRHARE